MKKLFFLTEVSFLALFVILSYVSLSWAMGHRDENINAETSNTTTNSLINSSLDSTNADRDVNPDPSTGVSTSMNGNTSTTGGVAISSVSASKESKNASGNAN